MPGATLAYAAMIASCAMGAPAALALDADSAPLTTVVVTATAIPGADIEVDKVPGNVQVINSADIVRDGSASLTGALNTNLSSISINDDIADPFQPDILYRGFEASPVLGTPQGLAVYQNGVRINEAFGDTVNWDLFPDVAVDKVELVSSSPVYGRNALGGAVSVTMKNGFSYQGGDLELAGGSYGRRSVSAQYGVSSGIFGLYVASRALDWTGWRQFSDDRMRDVYAVLSLHTDTATLDLSYTRSNNDMRGQGSAPVQELAVNRSLVFTGPQANVNGLNFFTLNGTWKMTDGWSLQGVLYYRQYSQFVSNGNTTSYTACTDTPGILCQPDGSTPLTDATGGSLPDISDDGANLLGENDVEQIDAWSRGVSFQVANKGSYFGHDNELAAGVSLDYSSTSFYTGAQIGALNSQLVVLPSALLVYTPEDSAAAADFGDPVPVSVDSVNKSLGYFISDTFNVTPDLAVTASGRYNISNINLVDRLGSNLDGYNRFVHFNPAIGATYKVLPNMTLYGGIADNTRTPTASEIECSDPLTPCLLPTNLAGDPPNLKQVLAQTTEIGLRGTIPHAPDGQVTWNLSAFRTLLENDIFGVATSVSQGFFQNIGDTRREGFEAGIGYHGERWSAYANYSLVRATFQSALTVPSPSNPFRDDNGDLAVTPGDRMPGIPENRVKLGVDLRVIPQWTVGADLNYVGSFFYVGDESNQLAPIPGYAIVNLHTSYRPFDHFEIFASVNNLFDRKYATWGILSDPTGINAPGIAPDGVSNGPGVDNRFLSPGAPIEVFAGIRLML
ncbi:MAG TPA: TonB-dependent receptor [Steroidobacteraceae bacterium]|nr:TonB-dependent receptor [Steroidobacteraceae bacterium]